MSGRRSHTRFAVVRAPEGVLRVSRDVVVQSTANEQILALSHEPGVLGELVFLQLPEIGALHARVLESVPVMVDGSVRHQLRLHPVAAPDGGMSIPGGTPAND